jgi:hypothetical protein
VLSVGSLHRAKRQLDTLGEVRDQRKHNKSEAKLSLAQTEAVVSLIYDEWIQHKHVDYGKVKEFTRRVQCDEEICSALMKECTSYRLVVIIHPRVAPV